MLPMHLEEHVIEHSIEISDLFDSIAESMQNDDTLDMSYDEILEHLESNADHRGYVDVRFNIIVNTDKKTISDIM